MTVDPPAPNLVALRDARDAAIAQLSDAFAHDLIEVEEFERRLTIVHRSGSVAEIEQTVSDLASQPSVAGLIVPSPAPLAAPSSRESDRVVAIFAGVQRQGPWTLARHLRAVALMGGMVLDLREASLLPGVTEIEVLAIMGGAQIIVPPGLAVEVTGTAIMGGFAHLERIPAQVEPERSVLCVRGFALMGGVAVETRLIGESEMDAHRRRRREARALRPGHEPKQLPAKTRT
jgi:hypothetical protein